MDASPTPSSTSSFRLSNLQVILILLLCGVFLIGATWVVAQEFGRVPLSLWDICTSVVPDLDRSASTSSPMAMPVPAPVKP